MREGAKDSLRKKGLSENFPGGSAPHPLTALPKRSVSARKTAARTEPVGYGCPPEATRFQKGTSGNPRGRPKGSLNVSTMLAQTLREKIVLNQNGRKQKVTKLEAALKQLATKAAGGDLRAIAQLLGLARQAEEKDVVAVPQKTVLGEIDKQVMQGILDRFQVPDQSREGQEEKNDHADRT
jgi:hypothetical protein